MAHVHCEIFCLPAFEVDVLGHQYPTFNPSLYASAERKLGALQLARASHNPDYHQHTAVHAGMEWVDTSVQKIVYGTLERTSHTVMGRALPPVMLRSFVYQLLHALAWCHARGVAHGGVVGPLRALAHQ